MTLDLIQEFLAYDPTTGSLTWRKSPRRGVAKGSDAGSRDRHGHIWLAFRGHKYAAHRLAFFFMRGEHPARGLEVDHINGVPHDNRFSNLRLCSHKENLRNGKLRSGKSQFKGVAWYARHQKWMARITIDGQSKHLGYFAVEQDAARTYDAAAIKHFGEFARLNFPNEG